MNRRDFQGLARTRIKEAKVLLDSQLYDGAYYLAGYAVECALKACIAKKTKKYDFPPKRKSIERIYNHNLRTLVEEAGLEKDIESEKNISPDFNTNWSYVLGWSEEARYELKTAAEATDLYSALTKKRTGILQWLKRRW